MAITITAQLAHPSVRHFSAHRPRHHSRTARAVAMSYLIFGIVIPFIPPALESLRQKNLDFPDSNKPHPPLCFHAR
ncbi:hypothetical protein BDV26DRAFT_288542 [Aspergillus bertholletiae]|uniref:Uncharacterized protein n=1 Tax=Aspergillus bertholletiae TaxID=1226010 RepID=A0A5N7BL70_9EURO|nr:hypothetical protein BDV26DRAFT_288542 [Aspergillus bertholletiae]